MQSEQTETDSGISAKLTNTSEKTIGDVYFTALYYDSNGKLTKVYGHPGNAGFEGTKYY